MSKLHDPLTVGAGGAAFWQTSDGEDLADLMAPPSTIRDGEPIGRAPYSRHIPELWSLPQGEIDGLQLWDLPVWCCWKTKPPSKPGGKMGKVPVSPKTGRTGGWSVRDSEGESRCNLEFFTDAATAWQYAQDHPEIAGIGIATTREYGIAGGDPDHSRDPETGEMSEKAREILEAANTYAEVSPGQAGYRFLFIGSFGGFTGNRDDLEFYEDGRFLTITGDHVAGTPDSLEHRDLTELGRRYFPPEQESGGKPKRKASPANPAQPQLAPAPHRALDAFMLPSHVQEWIIHGVADPKLDRSNCLFGAAKDLFKAGATRSEVLEILSNPEHGISIIAADHTQTPQGSARCRQWLERYTLDKAQAEVTTAAMTKTPEEVAAALDALDIPEPERPGAFPIPESCKGTFAVRMGLDMARATEMPQATAVITALGAFSGVLSMAFCTGYADGSRLPVGLYTVAEQPPGTAKSRLLNSFATPWLRKVRQYNAERMEEAEAEAEQEEGGKPKKPRLLPLPFSNATPEAMEQAMTQDDTGHYWLQSAEQGAIRMLFGDGVKDRPKNFDLALKGFNGEFHSSARVTRQKLLKEVYGAITVLAQAGSIRTILSNSDGDGLAERFLFVAEPHNLGKRTHDAGPPDPFLKADLEQALGAVMRHYQTIPEDKRGELEDLHYLGFSDTANEMIRQHKIRIEPKLAQHADNGEMVLTAILSKSDMQAMKLAAVMYLSDCLAAGRPYAARIPDEYLTSGLELTMTLVKHIETVLVSMERIGPEAAREVIRRQFDKRPERTIREIVQNVKKVKPFRDNPSPSAYAKRIITGMVNRGELIQVGNRLQLG